MNDFFQKAQFCAERDGILARTPVARMDSLMSTFCDFALKAACPLPTQFQPFAMTFTNHRFRDFLGAL
jgi:hypothetical protein